MWVRLLAGQLIRGEALAKYLAHSKIKALAVIQAPAIVISECLVIQIAEQVKRLNTHICAAKRSLEQGPKILTAVDVDFATNLLYRVA